MPNFEQSSSRHSSSAERTSFTNKLIAFFEPSGTSPQTRSHKAKIGFKTNDNYRQTLLTLSDLDYQKTAGCDISSIFYPFQAASGVSIMPNVDANSYTANRGSSSGAINISRLMPYQWDISQSAYIYDRYAAVSGDAHTDILSSSGYYKNPDRYRDISDFRSIGLRLPAMAVGWGFTHDGIPYPSGNNLYQENGQFYQNFKGEVKNGWEVDPKDYVAAPIDLRYDKQRNVWSAPKEGFWAEILDGSGIGPYVWRQKVAYNAGMLVPANAGSGYGNPYNNSVINPAYSASLPMNMVPSGTHVYLYYNNSTRTNLLSYFFSPPVVGIFPVRVYKDGGNDATDANTLATWTYTVKSMEGNTLGSQIQLAYPRPYGSMIYQPSGFGMAFYHHNMLYLASAGEFANTIFCDLAF